MSNIPPEVRQYLASGPKRIISVSANPDYTLALTYNNGESCLYDMREAVEHKPFNRIKHKFSEVFLDDCGSVAWDIDRTLDSNAVWNNRVCLCPDSCYIYSKLISKEEVSPLNPGGSSSAAFSNGK